MIANDPDNINGWIHKGFALYGLGHCAEAGAALYHALLIDEENRTAQDLLSGILDDPECDYSLEI